MRDMMTEVIASMKNNKMRIALTGFAIGWGIFILIVILGSGNGLVNGITRSFGSDAKNILRLTPGKTQMDYAGFRRGRSINIHPADIEFLQERMKESLAEVHTQVSSDMRLANYNGNQLKTPVIGVNPGFMDHEDYILIDGRGILYQDVYEQRKVCIISDNTQHLLFKKKQHVVGEYIDIGGLVFQVVGVYKTRIESQKINLIYAPQSTVVSIFVPNGSISKVTLVAKNVVSEAENEEYIKNIYQTLGESLHFNPSDRSAIKCNSFFGQFSQLMGVLSLVKVFIWIVGIATLMGGVVGVSNIMMITIKERTRELGVRRAMGASAFSIIRLVLLESVIITLIFGYMGMFAGVGLTQLASWTLSSTDTSMFYNTTVSLEIVVIANVIMVLAGLFAGYVPAKKAVSTKLVDSLNG